MIGLLLPVAVLALVGVGAAFGRRRALADHRCPQIHVSPEELDIP
ncbi:MAG: hypothetical protein PGN37_20370 [Mycobacterium kyogaense]